ncbi:hypothetical protein [Klebsiella oxytoca]
MNIETVNELIQSLEGAGELSIKERRYLELAKAYEQLAAENVALKAGIAEEIEVINLGGQMYCVKDGMSINPIYARGWNDHRANVKAVQTPATDRIVAGIKADGVDSGIKTIITMLNHQAPGVIDAINVLSVHSFELREGADK